MGDLRASLALAAQLVGRKRLVPGNHDRVSSLYRGSPAKKAEWERMYLDAGFEILSEELRAGIYDTPVKVSHFPYDGDSHGEDRYKDHDRDEIPHSPSQPPPTLARCLSEPLSRSMRMAWLSCCGVSPPTRATCRRAPSPCVMIEM